VPIYKLSRLHKHNFDIAIFNLAEQYKWALRAKAKKRVFWALAPEALYKHPDVPIKALMQDFFFMANSTFSARYVKDYRTDLKYEIPIIPGGINPSHFKYDPRIPKDYHILYYGSARPWKGTRLIEQACLGLKLETLKMEGSNTPQHKMFTLYNRSTLFVSAGQVEGFNFPILEAMACGCPVICTDDGGSRDFVKNGVNALVVARHANSIRDGVKNLLRNKKLRRRLSAEGLKTASNSKYKWPNVTKKLEQVLLSIL
jgi:glycosyltransferase involved in cell wall biosynthesis